MNRSHARFEVLISTLIGFGAGLCLAGGLMSSIWQVWMIGCGLFIGDIAAILFLP